MPEPPRLARFLANTLWSLWGLVVLSALSFLLLPLMVRGLGLEGYALYTLMGTFTGYLGLLTLGSGNTVVKFVSERRGRGDADGVRSAAALGLGLHSVGVLAGACVLFAARGWLTDVLLRVTPAARADAAFLVGAAASAAVFASLLQFAVAVNQGLQRFALANVVLVVQSVLVLGGSALLVWLGFGLRSLAVYFVAAHAVLCALALPPAWAALPPAGSAPRAGAAPRAEGLRGEFASFALHTFLAQLAWSATFQWDRLVLGARLPLADLTYYLVPAMLLQKLSSLPSSVMVSLFPMISEMEGRGEADALARVYLRGGQFVLWLVVPGFVLLGLLAPQFLSLWLGGDFSAKGVWPLRMLAVGYFFNMLGALPTTAASGRGRPAYTAGYQAAQAALCLAGWVVFIPRWGLAGAALSFALAQAFASVPFVWLVSRDLFGIGPAQYAADVLARPLAAGAGLLLALWPLRESATGWTSLALLCALGTAAYAAAGFLFVAPGEREVLRRMWAAATRRAGAA